mmetsp:Transcript_42175/g.48970  ORF Transcript_42175/g.48970 Transcript_42175/m.48970 type:complete len:659 (-) Transcript_42175:1509-3485(-)
MYGTGSWDLFVNDIASFSSGDILVGGKSFSTKSAGEGFLMRIDKYGKLVFQKLYQSTASGEDSIDKVAIATSSELSIAVGHSTTGSANTYFVLKLAADGTVSYNYQLGNDATKIGTDSVIFGLVAASDTVVQVYFDGTVSSARSIFMSSMTLDSSTPEVLFGLRGISTVELIRSFTLSATATLLFAVSNGMLMALYSDALNALNSNGKYVTNNVMTLSVLTFGSHMDVKADSSEGWIAVISSDSKIYGFHATVSNVNTMTMARNFVVSGISSLPKFVKVIYVDSTHCVVTAYLTDNSIMISKVDQSTTGTPTVSTKTISGFTNNKFIPVKLTTGMLFASNMIGGESASLTKSQGIIYKSADDMTFLTYSCYEVSTTATLTIASYTTSNTSLDLPTLAAFGSAIATGTVSKSQISTATISSTTNLVIRAQSVKDNNAGTAKCKLQPATVSYSAATYAVLSSATDTDLATATQFQGASLVYTPTVTGQSSLPSWVKNSPTSTLAISPSQVRAASFLTGNTVSVTVSDTNAVPQTATGSFVTTFTNAAPTAAGTVSAQTMYKGMGAKTVSIPSSLFTDSVDTLTVAVSNNLSGVTPTTFSLSGTTLTIQMPNTYTGSFVTTVTATDYVGQTATTTFTTTVSACTQSFCDYCTGTGATDCTQ